MVFVLVLPLQPITIRVTAKIINVFIAFNLFNIKLINHLFIILLKLWGDDSFFNSRSLHVFITKLRHKLSADENIRIINVRGIGAKMIC